LTPLGVLASGRGSNLAAIIESCRRGDLPAQVVYVASNRASCLALDVARRAGVPGVRAFPLADYANLATRDAAMAEALQRAGVDLVVTAGYDRVLDEGFVVAFEGRILNVHPSLLPAFAGTMSAIQEAFQAGVRETGVTVHMIEPNSLDGGRIIAQEAVEVLRGDTVETLEQRIHQVEHRLLPQSIKTVIESSRVR
jgi:phosphoribosylglycinamide formyltransferase-1